jgi:hypothetical protein
MERSYTLRQMFKLDETSLLGSICQVSFSFPSKRKQHLDLKLPQTASCSVRSNLFRELQMKVCSWCITKRMATEEMCKNKNVCWLCDAGTHPGTEHTTTRSAENKIKEQSSRHTGYVK